MSVINTGDVLATIILLGFSLIIVVLLFNAYKKSVKRAKERIEIEKHQTMNLQKQLNERVSKIENLLKEVD